MTRLRHGAATAVGRVRRVNEDSYLTLPPLYAVADGMGGHGAGDLASALAIRTLESAARILPLTPGDVLAALAEANAAIVATTAGRAGQDGMGTTITGLALIQASGGSHVMVFNVGDSRVYRLVSGGLDQVTVDHSEVEELVLAGALTREQARTDPRRNVVTRALGTCPAPTPDHWLLPAVARDRYLICSDGLFNELPQDSITRLLAVGDPSQAAAALVAAADDAGGHDNITAVVVDVDQVDDEPADEDTTPRDLLPGQS